MSGKLPNNCEKIPYDSKAEAEQAISNFEIDKERGYSPVRSYKCDRCGKWHMTSKEKGMKPLKKTAKNNHRGKDWTKMGEGLWQKKKREEAQLQKSLDKSLKKKKNRKSS